MPTRTSHNPFASQEAFSQAHLAAYVEGRLSPAEQHAVEAQMERDPLLRDAIEGLQQPDALTALTQLGPAPVRDGRNGSRWSIAGGVVAIIAIVTWTAWPDGTIIERAPVATVPPDSTAAWTEEHIPSENVGAEEIAAAVEVPATQRIGHRPDDLHAKAMEHVTTERVSAIDRLDHIDPAVQRTTVPVAPQPHRTNRGSLQLMYLFDLKLVDPKELHSKNATLRIDELGVDASHTDQTSQAQARGTIRTMAYTAFMDGAMSKFARNDHRGCLKDLQFLLAQYPDDVNALFYAGLCSYNLGLYPSARSFLHRAATHTISVFDEESEWYYALTLERLGETESANELLTRIAAQKGFYSARAEGELRHR